jgi:succinate dehydrogenase hydrophobic anchor subunit
LAFIGAIFAVQCDVMFIKNNKEFLEGLGRTMFFEAFFFLWLIPSSVHHLLGFALSWTNVDAYVGLSFLLQALLIAPCFLMLSYCLRKTQNRASIIKLVTIATSVAVWGFWVSHGLTSIVPLLT